MAKTEQDVITKALRRLNVIASGEMADADLYQEAVDEYRVFHEWGREEFRGKWSWNYNSVDDRYWTHVAAMLASRLIGAVPVSEAIQLKAERKAAESERFLREQLARRPLDVTPINYF